MKARTHSASTLPRPNNRTCPLSLPPPGSPSPQACMEVTQFLVIIQGVTAKIRDPVHYGYSCCSCARNGSSFHGLCSGRSNRMLACFFFMPSSFCGQYSPPPPTIAITTFLGGACRRCRRTSSEVCSCAVSSAGGLRAEVDSSVERWRQRALIDFPERKVRAARW